VLLAWPDVKLREPSLSIRDFQHDLAAFVGGASEHLMCHLCLIERQDRRYERLQRVALEQVCDFRQSLVRHIDKHEDGPNAVPAGLQRPGCGRNNGVAYERGARNRIATRGPAIAIRSSQQDRRDEFVLEAAKTRTIGDVMEPKHYQAG
jgi:hypothetical protein